MKITNAKVIVCSPGRNFVTLKLETDEGVYGLGDATLNGRELAVVAALEQHCFDGITTLIVHGDGAVSIDRNGRREIAYTPRRMKQREEAR